jgi:thioredoxin 1
MGELTTVSDSNFDQAVLQAEVPVLVDFWAPWCRPCLMIGPLVAELAKEYGDRVSFVKLDVDQSPKIATKYSVMSIPTLIIFKNGAPASHIVGLKSKADLKKSLDSVLD